MNTYIDGLIRVAISCLTEAERIRHDEAVAQALEILADKKLAGPALDPTYVPAPIYVPMVPVSPRPLLPPSPPLPWPRPRWPLDTTAPWPDQWRGVVPSQTYPPKP